MIEFRNSIYRSLKVSELSKWIRYDIYSNLKEVPNKKDLIEAIRVFDELKMFKHSRYLRLKYEKLLI